MVNMVTNMEMSMEMMTMVMNMAMNMLRQSFQIKLLNIAQLLIFLMIALLKKL